ncbi:MAG: ABC transporter substrate-binding protein [Bacteroidota bacterium]
MKKITLFTLLVGLVIFFTDCRTDPDHKESEVTALDFKHKDNVVYVRLRADADNLHPYIATSTYAQQVYQHIFPYLLYFSPEDASLEPVLVKERAQVEEVTEGPYKGSLSYTFELLDEAQWDNGQTVTAADVIFSFKAMFTNTWPNQRARGTYEFVDHIETYPNNPKRFTFYTRDRYILSEVQLSTISILPAYVYDPKNILADFALADLMDADHKFSDAEMTRLQEFGDNFVSPKYQREADFVIGCGPYKLENWETKQRIILKKKDNWWGDKLADKYPMLEAKPKEIYYKIISDQTTAVAALRDQEVDAIDQIQPQDYLKLKKDERINAFYDLDATVRLAGYGTAFNMRRTKLQQKEVRRALTHLFDIDNIMSNILYDMGEPINSPIHPTKSYYNRDLPAIPFDLAEAKKLLAAAGWSDSNGNGIVDKEIDGEQVELEVEYLVSSSIEEQIAILFQNSAAEVQVGVNIVKKEFVTKLDDLRKHNFDLVATGWRNYPMLYDPYSSFHSESAVAKGGNYSGISIEKLDQLIADIRSEIDEEKRNKLYADFQKLIYDEQPIVFLFSPLNPMATSKRFDGKQSSIGYYVNTFELKNSARLN